MTDDAALPRPPTVFEALVGPGGASRLTTKRALVAFSHVLEDEAAGSDLGDTQLFAAFQLPRYYEPARARWRELAARAASAYVFATFDEGTTRATTGPVEVAIDPAHPLRREWLVVVDRREGPMALTARERPGQDGVRDTDRLFDAAWTVDPPRVRKAARICALTAAAGGAPGAEAVQFELSALAEPAVPLLGLEQRLRDLF